MKSSDVLRRLIAVSFVLSMLTCGENPVDPELNPGNSNAELFLVAGNGVIVNEGEVRKIGLGISYPIHLAKVTISSTCGIFDTVIIPDSGKRFDTLYFAPVFTVPGKCTFVATSTFKNSIFREKQNELLFSVYEGAPGVSFVTVPKSFVTQTGKVDTLILTSKTTGSAIAQEYAVSSVPVLDQTQLSVLQSASKDTMRILFKPAAADTYTVSVVATAQVPGALPVKATALVGVRVYGAVVPTKTDVPQNIIAGIADTLRFTVDNSTRPDKLTMKLVTDKPLDAAIFTILPSSADSILIAVAAGATTAAGTVKIGVSTSNGVITDTSWYPITFVDKESAFWNVAEVAVAATEGVALRYDLRPYFVKSPSGSVTFTSDIGTVTADTFWQYTPAYGTATPVKATITAQKGTATLGFKVTVNVTATDSIPPTLTLVDATLNGKKVSSPQITVASTATDNGAGVAKVSYSWGGKTVDAAIQADNSWSGIITGLENGKATDVTITATDKSMKKNSASIKFTVTYEAATSDTTPPVITTQPEPAVSVIEGQSLTLTVAATGTSALTYQWYKNDVLLPGQTNATLSKSQATDADTGSYYVVVAKSNGRDVASTKAVVTIRLNAKITEDPVSKEANEGGGATFTVKAEGEAPLSYQWLKDGTAINGATVATYPLNSVAITDDKKSFKCIVSNSFSKDTSAAATLTVIATPVYKVSFSLDGGTPAVSDQDVKQGGKATAPTGTLTKANFEFGGWYKDAQFTTAFDFTTQTITVATVIYAKWIPVYTVIYDKNGAESGSVPVDSKKYKSTETASVLGNTGNLKRGGYDFAGWNIDVIGTGTVKNPGDVITIGSASIVLYAKWTKILCTVTFDGQGATTAALPGSKVVETGSTLGVLPTDPKKTNFIFIGWYTQINGGGERITTTSIISNTLSIYAYWADGNSIVDIDGNVYTTVAIGSQTWSVENLRVTKYNDGSQIVLETSSVNWSSGTSGKYCFFNNSSNPEDNRKVGALYNWRAVNTGKLAPIGWHVPTKAEWEILKDYLILNGFNWDASVSSNKIAKSMAARSDWIESSVEGTVGNWLPTNNSSGFSALPAGYRYDYLGAFQSFGYAAGWWTSTATTISNSYSCFLNNNTEYLSYENSIDKGCGLSIRLIKD